MVDILGIFRRRAAKRGPPGFARSREDITALGDSFGDMLTSPVRDAPPLARTAPDWICRSRSRHPNRHGRKRRGPAPAPVLSPPSLPARLMAPPRRA
jgi:lipopolysaccharide export system ATP-binding protein